MAVLAGCYRRTAGLLVVYRLSNDTSAAPALGRVAVPTLIIMTRDFSGERPGPDSSTEPARTASALTRRRVLRTAGVATGGALVLGTVAGNAVADGDAVCEACVRFSKVDGAPEPGDEYELEYGGITVVVRVLDVRYEDGEPVAFEWRVLPEPSYRAVCKVVVKGGPRREVRTYDGAWNAWAAAPAMHDRNPNRTRYAISNITFYFCLESSEVKEDEDDYDKDDYEDEDDDKDDGDKVDYEDEDDDGPPYGRGRGRGPPEGRGRGRGRSNRGRGRGGR